jgi:hypothetical protein
MKLKFLSILFTGVLLSLQLNAQSFSGGSGDGYASALSTLQAGSQTGYFAGGPGGGFASNVSLTFSGSYDKFYGGDGDGYSSLETMNFSFTPAKFQGSIGDGFATAYSPVVKYQSAVVAAMPRIINPQRTKDYFTHTEEAFRDWTAYPNPFREDINIEISLASESQLGFELYDMMGRLLLQQSHHLQIGSHQILLKPGPLPSGSYLLLMRKQGFDGNQEVESLRLIRAPATH